ncbi:hypothetical protein LTR78_000257 [Recurvomyces mirabilis]|uniref:Uncharacterized protein n=1 Tax=Recurvomyces mirabilis TaxID=574656 RepID=A0AAE1C6E9_9PEZI|nr:hypothetical protein LTR78_000257 [Recurvomyces mirabilis]KAK5161913.1 hypothetical protein LTS14_000258 [Recurvomyces mirabilis]
MNGMMVNNAHELFAGFVDELARSWSNTLDSKAEIGIEIPANPVLGALTTIRVDMPIRQTWMLLLEAFPDAARHTTFVRSYWQRDESLYIRAGRESLRAVRNDRGMNSRYHSTEFAEPYLSTRRLQLLKLIPLTPSLPVAPLLPPLETSLQLSYDKHITSAYLSFALRMNPHDIASVLAALEPNKLIWVTDSEIELDHVLGNKLSRATDPEIELNCTVGKKLIRATDAEVELDNKAGNVLADDTPLRVALSSLELPKQLGCVSELRQVCTPGDASIGRPHHSASNTRLSYITIVLLHACSFPRRTWSTSQSPSCAVVFRSMVSGTPDDLSSASTHPGLPRNDHEQLSSRTPRLATRTTKARHGHRATGNTTGRRQRTSSKTALSSVTRGSISRDITVSVDGHRPTGPPRTYVIWTRQSVSETAVTTSIPRQIWSTLTAQESPLTSMRSHDRLLVFVEYCSSSAHPWRDRQLIKHIPRERPLILLTSNPDRLSRRPEEIKLTVEDFLAPGDTWLSRGAGFDGVERDTWFDVEDEVGGVTEQLRCGRQKPMQLSFYTRAVTTMTRCILAADNQQDAQITALQDFFRLVCKFHHIGCFVVIIRQSPPRGTEREGAQDCINTLARQEHFVNIALSRTNVEVRYLQLPRTSAYGPDVVDAIASVLEGCPRRTMLISSALDRVVRSRANYDFLQRLLLAGDHCATSLVWDSSTNLHPGDAMQLPAPA